MSDHTTIDQKANVAPIKQSSFPIFHPILFAIYPLLLLFASNQTIITPKDIALPILYSVIATLIIWMIAYALMRNNRKSAIAASTSIILIFLFGHLKNLLGGSLSWLSGPLCVFALSVVVVFVVRTKKELREPTKFLNAISIFLLIPSLWGVATHKSSKVVSQGNRTPTQSSDSHLPKVVSHRKIAKISEQDAANLPDIYYIILDAYGREDRLQQYYGLNNKKFIGDLSKLGFFVAKNSSSNYDQTPLCLASALNFEYLDTLVDRKLSSQDALEKCRQLLDDNAVANFLSERGYKYVHIGSGYGEVRVDSADVDLNDTTSNSEYEEEALGLTPLNNATSMEVQKYNEHRSILNGVFDDLKYVGSTKGPKFVYAHALAPHPPFVFGDQGEPVNPKGSLTFADGSWLLNNISREDYIRGYTNQLKYINTKILDAVKRIISSSKKPPIIIVQGDHGSRMNMDWDYLERTDVREVFGILNAYYVPDYLRKDLYDSITPINSFRVILHDIFGAKLTKLPDRSYYSTSSEPVNFKDVTDSVSPKKH